MKLDPNLVQVALAVMCALAAGGIIYVFVMPFLSGERKTEKRMRSVTARRKPDGRGGASKFDNNQARRKQVQETLNELEKRQKTKSKITLGLRLEQAGLDITEKTFFMISVLCGLVASLLVVFLGSPIYMIGAAALAAGIGFPRWVLKVLAKRRQKKFTEEFANAVDIIVRGIKSGLPLNDCLRIISAESQEPVKSEFADIVEQQKLGVTVPQALEKLYERVPLEEVNFFAIVITIQQQSGGNLAEALSNLSGVLRDRKRLRGKIKAFSAEAKSSAGIIAALPIAVMMIVYVTTPDYILLLWTDPTGNVMLAGSAIWMTIGILVMRNMINFDY
ncbi:MAG: type II secretion system F family protein [Methyloligellaceae bacterium]